MAEKTAYEKPSSRLICVSVMPRSCLMGSTSRFMICRSMALNVSASVKMATPYQARAGLGHASSCPASPAGSAARNDVSIRFHAFPEDEHGEGLHDRGGQRHGITQLILGPEN